nr:uncharacterized protein LOC129276502 [Lytechinus pictus]
MEEESSGADAMDKEVTVTKVSEGSADFVRIKQEVDLPEDDTYYPMDFGISVDDEEEMNPVYVNIEPGSSELPEDDPKSSSTAGKDKAKARSLNLRRGRSRSRSQSANLNLAEPEGWESEDGLDGYVASTNGGPQPKKTKIFSSLSNAEEESMVKWIRETDCLYNKKRMDYRDHARKDVLWAAKAKELGKKANILQVWYKSIRTRYVKLSRKKSRCGVADLTDRDHWIMMKFNFLAKHIGKVRHKTNFRNTRLHNQVHVPPMVNATVSICPAPSSPRVYQEGSNNGGPGVKEESTPDNHLVLLPHPPAPDLAPPIPSLAPAIPSSLAPAIPSSLSVTNFSPGPNVESISRDALEGGPRAQTATADGEAKTGGVAQRYEQFVQMQERVLMTMLQPRAVNERSAFGDWLKAVIEGFDRSVWREFQMECSQLVYKYQCRNDQVLSSNPSQPSMSFSVDNDEQPEGES